VWLKARSKKQSTGYTRKARPVSVIMLRSSLNALRLSRNSSLSHRNKTVVIGDTVVNKTSGCKPNLVPPKQFDSLPQELVQHLRWMGQKYNLKQVPIQSLICFHFFDKFLHRTCISVVILVH